MSSLEPFFMLVNAQHLVTTPLFVFWTVTLTVTRGSTTTRSQLEKLDFPNGNAADEGGLLVVVHADLLPVSARFGFAPAELALRRRHTDARVLGQPCGPIGPCGQE